MHICNEEEPTELRVIGASSALQRKHCPACPRTTVVLYLILTYTVSQFSVWHDGCGPSTSGHRTLDRSKRIHGYSRSACIRYGGSFARQNAAHRHHAGLARSLCCS
jgi:hypothetical protein